MLISILKHSDASFSHNNLWSHASCLAFSRLLQKSNAPKPCLATSASCYPSTSPESPSDLLLSSLNHWYTVTFCNLHLPFLYWVHLLPSPGLCPTYHMISYNHCYCWHLTQLRNSWRLRAFQREDCQNVEQGQDNTFSWSSWTMLGEIFQRKKSVCVKS